MSQPKLVSVIMATYNRSNIISYAIRTVLRQTYPNWELIVVGDCCTDDTEAIVTGFNDPRIKFTNLAENVGEQSGPNNAGLALAKGEYIAFLNHDDLWFEDHLSNLIGKLESEDLDLVYSWWYTPRAPGQKHVTMVIDPALSFNLKYAVPASCWVFKKHLINSVGYWKYFKETYNVPSQEWLKRAHLHKVKIMGVPMISTIAVQSGNRLNSYRERHHQENGVWFDKLCTPAAPLRIQLLTEHLIEKTIQDESVLYHVKSSIWNLVKMTIARFRFQPTTIRYIFKFGAKGGAVNNLRLKRGLNKI